MKVNLHFGLSHQCQAEEIDTGVPLSFFETKRRAEEVHRRLGERMRVLWFNRFCLFADREWLYLDRDHAESGQSDDNLLNN
jgi:hypothetical protein